MAKGLRRKTSKYPWVKSLIVFLLIAGFLGICYLLKGVLISLLLAFTIAYIFDPVVDFIEQRKAVLPNLRVPRPVAITLLITTVILIGAGILAYAVPKTIHGAQQLTVTLGKEYPHYKKLAEEFMEKYGYAAVLALIKTEEPTQGAPGEVVEEAKETKPAELKKELKGVIPELKEYIPKAFALLLGAIKKVFYSTFGIVGIVANFFIFSVVTLYLLKDFKRIVLKLKEFIPPSRKEKVLELLSKVDTNLRGFLRGQITVCMILSLIYSFGLILAGVPLAFLVGFLSGIGNMIPFLGTAAGLILAMTLTSIEHHDIIHLAYVAMVFGVGQLIEGTFITPRVVGGRLGLSPVVIIISILIWGQLLGFLGLLLAVPVTSVAKVFIDEIAAEYKKGAFYLGGEL